MLFTNELLNPGQTVSSTAGGTEDTREMMKVCDVVEVEKDMDEVTEMLRAVSYVTNKRIELLHTYQVPDNRFFAAGVLKDDIVVYALDKILPGDFCIVECSTLKQLVWYIGGSANGYDLVVTSIIKYPHIKELLSKKNYTGKVVALLREDAIVPASGWGKFGENRL